MTREVLDDAHLVKHYDLGDEGDGFEPKRVAPHESPGAPASVEDDGEYERDGKKCPVRELIAHGVIGRAEGHLVLHQVDEQRSRRNEEEFHESVVDGDEVKEQVRVPNEEDQQVNLLSLAR